jgi:hypothetical protein
MHVHQHDAFVCVSSPVDDLLAAAGRLQAWIPEMGNSSPKINKTDTDTQIDALLKERERCQNELQKLKDIVGFTAQKSNGDYRTRDSYLPDTGPLYDTVRELQQFMFKKVADWPTINEGIEGEASLSESRDEQPSGLGKHALRARAHACAPECILQICTLRVILRILPHVCAESHVGVVSPAGAAATQAAAHMLQAGAQHLSEISELLAASEKARTEAEAQVLALQGKVEELQQLVDAAKSDVDAAKSDCSNAELTRQKLLSGALVAAGELKAVKQESIQTNLFCI